MHDIEQLTPADRQRLARRRNDDAISRNEQMAFQRVRCRMAGLALMGFELNDTARTVTAVPNTHTADPHQIRCAKALD